jgi:hypothetical protein
MLVTSHDSFNKISFLTEGKMKCRVKTCGAWIDINDHGSIMVTLDELR